MSSFGPSAQTQQAESGLASVVPQAQAASATDTSAGKGLLDLGSQNTNAGANYFNALLNGNQANTTALLQPNIDQIRAAQGNALNTASTLMPRGGGRSGTLFSAPFAANQQIQNLFNGVRSGAAGNLASIGSGQTGVGAGLLGQANAPLNTQVSANSNLADVAQRQQQMTQSFWSNLGGGLFGLATTPFGGGAAMNGLLGKL